MQFSDAVSSRSMTRSFDPTPLAKSLVADLLEEALHAPSAGFSQGVDLLVLASPTSRAHFWSLVSEPSWRESDTTAHGLMAAPCIVVPFGNPHAYTQRYAQPEKAKSSLARLSAESWPVPYWIVDASFFAMTLLLGTTNANLGALFFQLQGKENELRAGFCVPDHFLPIGAIAIGYPASPSVKNHATKRTRRDRSEVIHTERW
jgi:nitroreductase